MSATVALRLATPADVAVITALVRAAYAKWVPVIGREPMPMTVDYGQALVRHRIDLLLADDELVGLIETLVHPDHLWIDNIAVHPEYQGRGFGRHLLAHAETLARTAGCAQLRLLTNAALPAMWRYTRQPALRSTAPSRSTWAAPRSI